MTLWVPLATWAQTSWRGTVNTDWSNAGNWTAGVPSALKEAVIGDVNFTGAFQPTLTAKSSCKSLTLGTGNRASVLTAAKNLAVSGSILVGTNGTLNQGRITISLTGNWSNSGSYNANNNRSTVTFSGATQTISGATSFRRLSINGGSTTVLRANVNVSVQLSVSGTLDPGESPTFTVSGGGATLIVNSGAKLLVKASTCGGNYGQFKSTTLNAASTVDYAALGVNQTVSSALTYGTLRISGGLTKALIANLPNLNSSSTAAGNIIVAAGTFDLGSFTANRGTSVAGGSFTVANGASVRIGGTRTFPGNYRSHTLGPSSTVVYSGGSQAVSLESYGNLTLTSSGGATVKTMPTGAMTLGADLAATVGAGTSLSFAAGGALTVRGNLSIGPAVMFSGGGFAHTVAGAWTNNGTYAGGTGSVTFTGAGATISGSGVNNFYDLFISGSGVTVNSSTSLGVAGDLSTGGTGSFTHATGAAGTLNLTGAGKTVNGSGIRLNHVAVSGAITTPSSFAVNGDLVVTGSLVVSGGLLTMAGAGHVIAGPGVISLWGLSVPGRITTAADFSIAGDLAVPGSFTATAGTATFNGNSVLSGSANLSSVTLSGTRLQLGAGSVLGVAADLVVAGGTFDASTTVPNTVNYNGSAAQSITATSYHHLVLSGGGAKTTAGTLTAHGDLRIAPGATFTAGPWPHSIAGQWLNQGTFDGAGSTIRLVGGLNTSIAGATTFDTLTLAKSSPVNLVTLKNSVNAATVSMLSGTLLTDTNTLTITSDRTGPGIILGTIIRTHPFATGIPYAFEGPNNTISFSALTGVSAVTVTVSPGLVSDFPFGSAINRQYTLSLNSSGPYAATLRLHYEDGELNGNREAAMRLWRYQTPWTVSGETAADPTSNWMEQGGLSDLSGRWTLSGNADAVRWNGSVSGAWEDAANWTVVQGSPRIPPSTNDIVQLGDAAFGHQPTIASPVQVRSLSFGSAQGAVLTLASGGSLGLAGNGGDLAGTWTANQIHTLDIGAQALVVGGTLRLSDGTNGHAINVKVNSGSVAVTGDLIQSGSASIVFTAAGTLDLGGDFVHVNGTFDPGTGTVTYTGSGAQTVAGGVRYHHLAFNKPGGMAFLPVAAVVSGQLLVRNAGALILGAPLTVASIVAVDPGATLDGGAAELTLGGDWIVTGTFVPGASTVVFNGSTDQSVSGTVFNHLRVDKPSGDLTLTGSLGMNGDLEVVSGTLDLATFNVTRSCLGGTFTLAPESLMRIGTGSGFPSNFLSRSIADASTVEYSGSGPQVVTENAYGNLTLSNGGSNAKALAGTTSVAANLVINAGATLDAGGVQLNVRGDWMNHGVFIPSSSLVVLSGAAGTVNGATTFHDLSVPGSYAALDDVSVSGNMTVSGTYQAGGTTHILFGDFDNTGSFTSGGVVTFAGPGPQLVALNAGFSSSGTVNFNGTVAPTLAGLTPPVLHDVNINNPGGVAPATAWVIGGDFAVGTGASFVGRAVPLTFNGNFLNDGKVSSDDTLVFAPASAATIRLSGASFQSSGTVVFGGTGPITLQGGAERFGSVTVANTHSTGVTPVGNWSLTGDLFIAPGALFNGGGGLSHTVSGNWSNDGIFNGQDSTVELNGTSDVAGAGSTTFNHLIITGTVAATDDFSLAGDFTNNGVFDGAGSVVTFLGTAPSVIGGSTAPTPFDALTIAKSGATVTLASGITGVNALTVASGTLDAVSFAITQDPLGGALSVAADATLRIGGANSLPGFDAYDFDPSSTVEYYGSGTQTLAAQNYGNLHSSSSGGRILSSAGIIGIAGAFTPGSNVYTINGSTMNFNGTGAQTVPAFNYYNLASSSGGVRALATAGTIGIAASFTPGTNSYVASASTVDFNGAAQTIPVFSYYNLSVSGSGAKTLGGDATARGNLGLSAGTLVDSGRTLTVTGNATNNALHSGTGRILLTGGSAPHQLSGAGSYGNLELNDPNGASLGPNNLMVNGSLGLTSGHLVTASNRVIIGPAGSVTRVAGHVAGFLQKSATTGPASLTFEIGDFNAYAPVAVNFGAVTSAGSLTASTTPGDHPQVGGSGIAASRSLNRFWTLTDSGVLFNNYNALFTFVPADVDPGANPTNFAVAEKTPAGWVLPRVTATSATSIQATGLTAFGDFVAGESSAPGQFTAIRILPNGDPGLTFSGNPGQSYRIQAATNLMAPILWTTLSTNTTGLDGLIQFEDLQGTIFPMRFYRSASP